MTLTELLSDISAKLSKSGVSSSELEAEVILRHVLRMDRAGFYASLRCHVSDTDQSAANRLLARRTRGEPLAYITGHREFFGIDFEVDSNVLIPRQETESIVESVLNYASTRPHERLNIADIGTGSGAIAVSIALNLPTSYLTAVDISFGALEVARNNARRHRTSNRTHFIQGHLLNPLKTVFDVIVSNLPYIKSGLIPQLPREVRREPRIALDGGSDGLDLIRLLLRQSPDRIAEGGLIALEIDPEQIEDVLDLARRAFPSADIVFARDLLGLPRVVAIQT